MLWSRASVAFAAHVWPVAAYYVCRSVLLGSDTSSSHYNLQVTLCCCDRHSTICYDYLLCTFICRNVTESINSLLGLCSSNTPGQRECDNALRTIKASATMLDNINEPVNAKTFFTCQEAVRETAAVSNS